MKPRHLSFYARITLLGVVAVVMTACTSAPHYHDPDRYYSSRVVYYDYWYYPAIGAYYDPRARTYIYYEHDHWIRARALPQRIRPYVGNHVTVRSSHDRPYEEHYRHWEKHQPERYRERDLSHRGQDAWIGAPHYRRPQPDRDDRPINSRDRDRNDSDRWREAERGTRSDPSRYREPPKIYPLQTQAARREDAPRHREPPAGKASIKREERGREPKTGREESRDQYQSVEAGCDNERVRKHERRRSSTEKPEQSWAPDSCGRLPEGLSQAALDRYEPPTKRAPYKRDDMMYQWENRKADAQLRYRE